MIQLKRDEIVVGAIESIAFGGKGILRQDNFVVFIPFTAPGDQIRCRITEVKKNYAIGEMIDVIEASSERTTPPCPYYGTCGGCQLQHLKPEAQLKYKLEAVTDALTRIGRLTFSKPEAVSAQLNWAYRRHITLQLKEGKAGYTSTDHRSLIEIKTCPIFNQPEDPIISIVQELVRPLPDGRITILKKDATHYILSFHFEKELPSSDDFKEVMRKHPLFAGILLNAPRKQVILGDPFCELQIQKLSFRFTPQAFVQNHPEQSVKIYQQICSFTRHHQNLNILDLYCGFGITSLLVASQGHHVTGIEFNREAIKFARKNSDFNQLKGTEFIQGDVEKELPKLLKKGIQFDFAIVNPPREGLTPDVCQTLLKASPKEWVYISCMPSTLARDLAIFCQQDYKIEKVIVYDMFPQTAHVETLVHLIKK